MTTAAQKIKAKRARRPIYLVVRKLVDPDTGELVGALVPANDIDARLLRERKFHVNREVRGELKQPRDEWKHRLIHKIGGLLVDNVEEFRDVDSHEAIKRLQRASGVCCEPMEIDLGTLGKVPVNVPRSLAFDEMDNGDFEHLFKGLTQYIGDHYAGVMLDEVRAEFWQMANPESSR